MKIPSGYGQSELTIAATIPSVVPGMLGGKVKKWNPLGSVGLLFPGMEAKIVIEEEASTTVQPGMGDLGETKVRDAELGEVGELWLRGANVALGYYRDEAATKATFDASAGDKDGRGWLRTGDRFSVDPDGFF